MSRSTWKGPYVHHGLLRQVEKMLEKTEEEKQSRVVQVFSRSSHVIPEMIGLVVRIHNGQGKKSPVVKVNQNMIGLRFGELARTRTPTKHSGDKTKMKLSVKR